MDEYQFEQAQLREEQQRIEALANRVQYQGESALECVECDVAIPEARRLAVPGCQMCVDCQQLRELKRG
ncbi:MAG: TraR/DksA C4-type zinc finger protein [Gammaproteobacteria bacterium]|uniref:Putative TraR/DksA family transcriptional regulator n=1 Tax=viral metagenome TaxID=1070528 RepID=A0A6M3MB93_9ZZZZ|nr:TraR/DksA C4-type zinc finger protein [Gammaproteobacteria bacterium]